MLVIEERNVEEVLFSALIHLKQAGQENDSRNGKVIEMPTPVTSVYLNPLERVVFDEDRDCNPFLHFFESIWMLAGSNDLNFVAQFAPNMATFSDDGWTLNGAYGHRWRLHFGYDQIQSVIKILDKAPTSRRAVISMWDGYSDLNNQVSKDLPCNTHVVFRVVNDTLDMTVFNRSNDAIWGAYGANAVHFSYLQEFIAGALGIPVGVYRQVSNNLHAYPDIPVATRMLGKAGESPIRHYAHGRVAPYPMYTGDRVRPQDIMDDCVNAVNKGILPALWGPRTLFYHEVANPLAAAWTRVVSARALIHNKADAEDVIDEYTHAKVLVDACKATDWARATKDWLDRRIRKVRKDNDLI